MQLILLEVVAKLLDNGNGKERGMVYISLLSIFANIWRWTVAYNLIQPEDNIHNNHNKSLAQIISEIINTPIIVSLVTIIICYIPVIRRLILTSFIDDTIVSIHSTISRSYTFLVIFMLGLNLANIDVKSLLRRGGNVTNQNIESLIESSSLNNQINQTNQTNEISLKKISLIVFMKLIVNPLIGAPILYYAYTAGYIKDNIFVFQLLFTLASPTAINLLVICNLKSVKQEFMTVFMLVVYTSSIITITVNNSLSLYILR